MKNKKQKKIIKTFFICLVISSLIALRFFYVKSIKSKKIYGNISTKCIDICALDNKKVIKSYFKEKDYIQKGDLLAEFDLTDINLKIKQIKTKINYEKEKETLLKFKEGNALEIYLNSKKDVTNDIKDINANLKKLEETQLLHKIQKSKIQMLEAQLLPAKQEKKKSFVYSPINGQITDAHAYSGKLLQAKEKLFSISNEENIWIDVKTRKADLEKFKLNDSFNISIKEIPDVKFKGKIFDISKYNDYDICLKVSINQIKKSPDEKTYLPVSNMSALLEYE